MANYPHDMYERVTALEQNLKALRPFAEETRKMIANHEKECAQRWSRIKLIACFVLGFAAAGTGAGIYNAKVISDVAGMVVKLAK